MPNTSPIGLCEACSKALIPPFQAFALQHHTIAYSFVGETPDEQAHLTLASTDIKAAFCRSACCKPALGDLLRTQGLPATMQHNKIQAGPLHPCGKCGKPVNMTQPHGAWVRCKLTSLDEAPDWFDVLAVMCMRCAGLAIAVEDDKQRDRARLRSEAIPAQQ